MDLIKLISLSSAHILLKYFLFSRPILLWFYHLNCFCFYLLKLLFCLRQLTERLITSKSKSHRPNARQSSRILAGEWASRMSWTHCGEKQDKYILKKIIKLFENTNEYLFVRLAQHISQELKRYSIPQAIFAQRVLCRSVKKIPKILPKCKNHSKSHILSRPI